MCEFCDIPGTAENHFAFGLFDPVAAVKRAEDSARWKEEERKRKKAEALR